MYCDDNIIGVVGVQRTIRLLQVWRTLVSEAGLVAAVPENRSLGVWMLWLGAIIFASIGIVVVPKGKLVRASTAIKQLATEGIPFSEYRSLIGLLEHIRVIT